MILLDFEGLFDAQRNKDGKDDHDLVNTIFQKMICNIELNSTLA